MSQAEAVILSPGNSIEGALYGAPGLQRKGQQSWGRLPSGQLQLSQHLLQVQYAVISDLR